MKMGQVRVKIFEEKSPYDLQSKINDFFRDNKEVELVDVKYSGAGSFPPYGIFYYSAMVIFKL